MSSSVAENRALLCLREMRDEVIAQKEEAGSCTLSYWRYTDPTFFKAMENFAASVDWDLDTAEETSCRQEVQELFTELNLAMVKQEQSILWPDDQHGPNPTSNQWSVVFGGKWAATACCIAEQLVHLLCSTGEEARVFTVSRTPPQDDSQRPCNVTHFSKQNLEEENLGEGEFREVINKVIDEYEAAYYSDGQESQEKVPIVFYFTLGKHTGNNLPFQRNIIGARNFAQALEEILPHRLIAKGVPWKVVVTGTDATCPSTQEDTDLGNVQGVPTTVPTYKVAPHNIVYAASKLAQFYTIAAATVSIGHTDVTPPLASTRDGNDGSVAAVARQLETFVFAAGDNGPYQENDYLTDKEFDEVSMYWTKVVEPSLAKQMQTAKHISICYTPLHRDPWTRMCLQGKPSDSPKKIMVQNIVWRMKNAISIDKAARAHF
jgi:hypothetical protein